MKSPIQCRPRLEQRKEEQLGEIALRLRGLNQNATTAVIATGSELFKAKDLLGHGLFSSWVQNDCGYSPRSAQMYMRVASFAEGKSERVSLFSLSSLYLLSRKSTPAPVVAIALAWLDEGKVATELEIKKLFEEHHKATVPDLQADPNEPSKRVQDLAAALFRQAGPALIHELTHAPVNQVLLELKRLLKAGIYDSAAHEPEKLLLLAPQTHQFGDAEHTDDVRATSSNTGEMQPPTSSCSRGPRLLTTPDRNETPQFEGSYEERRPQNQEVPAASGQLISSSKQTQRATANQINLSADTEGPLQGIPDFLRRCKPDAPHDLQWPCHRLKQHQDHAAGRHLQRHQLLAHSQSPPARSFSRYEAGGTAQTCNDPRPLHIRKFI
jgi:hypothetical protein